MGSTDTGMASDLRDRDIELSFELFLIKSGLIHA